MSELAQGLTEHVRHLLVLKLDPDAGDLVPMAGEDLARLREQASGWSEHDLLRPAPLRESRTPRLRLAPGDTP